MLVQTRMRSLGAKTIISDVATRTGMPRDGQYPFYGMLKVIEEKVGDSDNLHVFLKKLCEDTSIDFDYTKQDQEFTTTFSRLEDVPTQKLKSYLEQRIYAVRNYESKGMREHRKTNLQPQASLIDRETGRAISESELLTANSETYTEEDELLKSLSEQLTKIHFKSVETGLHLLSFFRAVQSIRRLRGRNIKTANLVSAGVYGYGKDGTVGRRFISDDFYSIGLVRKFDGTDLNNEVFLLQESFLYICRRMEIDMEHDDVKLLDFSHLSKAYITLDKLSVNVFDGMERNTATALELIVERLQVRPVYGDELQGVSEAYATVFRINPLTVGYSREGLALSIVNGAYLTRDNLIYYHRTGYMIAHAAREIRCAPFRFTTEGVNLIEESKSWYII